MNQGKIKTGKVEDLNIHVSDSLEEEIAEGVCEDEITFSAVNQVTLTNEVVFGVAEWCEGMFGYVSTLKTSNDGKEINRPFLMIKLEEKQYKQSSGKIKNLLEMNDCMVLRKKVNGLSFVYFLYETYLYDPKTWELALKKGDTANVK